jgi:hypothetical protein
MMVWRTVFMLNPRPCVDQAGIGVSWWATGGCIGDRLVSLS